MSPHKPIWLLLSHLKGSMGRGVGDVRTGRGRMGAPRAPQGASNFGSFDTVAGEAVSVNEGGGSTMACLCCWEQWAWCWVLTKVSFNEGPASGAVPVCSCVGAQAQGTNLLYMAAWYHLVTGVSQWAFTGTGCMCTCAACAHCTPFARMGKVSKTQTIIAPWQVSVEPSGGMQLATKVICCVIQALVV